MDQIGLITSYTSCNNNECARYNDLISSSFAQKYNEGKNDTLIALHKIQNTYDIHSILLCEEITLKHEIELYANSSQQINSINVALSQIEDAKESLERVFNVDLYKEISKTYSQNFFALISTASSIVYPSDFHPTFS